MLNKIQLIKNVWEIVVVFCRKFKVFNITDLFQNKGRREIVREFALS